MRNYALQKGPCDFLNLCTSPWEIPFLLLLCFSSLSVLLLPGVSLSCLHPYPHPGHPFLFSTRLGRCGPGSWARAGAEAGDAREPSGGGGRSRRARAGRAATRAAAARAARWSGRPRANGSAQAALEQSASGGGT
jgi:hypothetical protein